MVRLNEKTDPRILRTKCALREALVELILEQGYQHITVKRIAERAGLNRTTFYLHYQNKEDLLASEFTQLRDRLAEALPISMNQPPDNPIILDRKAVQDNFQYLKEFAPLYQAMLGKNGPPLFKQRLIEDLLAGNDQAHPQLDYAQYLELTLVYLVSGYLGLLEWWLETECSVSPAGMADLVIQLVNNPPGKVLDGISVPGRNPLP